ncbi:Hypothetical protein EIN_515940, partial [Entamoeba invadens IP1]
VKLNKL